MAKKTSDSHGGDRVQTSSASESQSAERVKVQILDQTLPIRSDRDEEFVQKIADYVSETVKQVRRSAPKVPTDKQLILASMSVAEELFEAREENEELRSEIRERAGTLSDLLDRLDD